VIKINNKVGGRYTLWKYKKGEEPKKVAEFDNLITDWGLKIIGQHRSPASNTQSGWKNNIGIGSNATAPHVSDMGLKTELRRQEFDVATTGGKFIDDVNEIYYVYSIYQTTFAPTGSAYIVREIGQGLNTGTNTGIVSRTITRDLGGDPVDIEVLGDEYLRVTYDLRLYRPYNDQIYTFNPDGDDTTQRTVTVRATNRSGLNQFASPTAASYGNSATKYAYVDPYNGALGDIDSTRPQGSNLGWKQSLIVTPTAGTAKIQIRATASEMNGSIRSLSFPSGNQQYAITQVEFDPPFIKNNEQVFNLDIIVTYERV